MQRGEETVVIPQPECYADCLHLVRSDYFRLQGQRKASWLRMCYTIPYQFWLRMSAYRGWLYPLCRLMHWHFSRFYSLQIAPTTPIGYGLYIGHNCGTIVNGTAVIGNNVNLSQFTTIGSNKGKAAFIGDNVYLGPSVCVIEDVTIASDSTVGAGAVVTRDVPKGCTVAGVPARVISTASHPEYVCHRWKTN